MACKGPRCGQIWSLQRDHLEPRYIGSQIRSPQTRKLDARAGCYTADRRPVRGEYLYGLDPRYFPLFEANCSEDIRRRTRCEARRFLLKIRSVGAAVSHAAVPYK